MNDVVSIVKNGVEVMAKNVDFANMSWPGTIAFLGGMLIVGGTVCYVTHEHYEHLPIATI